MNVSMGILDWIALVIGVPALIFVIVTDTKTVLITLGGLVVFIAILFVLFSLAL